jgi:hypothetical protein
MKKSILLIVMAILLSASLYSQCPTGYTQWIGTMTVGGCQFNVKVCYKCEVSGNAGEVQIFSFSKVNPNCDPGMNANEVYQALVDQIYNSDFITIHLCQSVPPCDVPPYGFEVILAYDVCWQKKNEGGIMVYHPCWDGQVICYMLWRYCWNGTDVVPVLLDGPDITGEIYCNGGEPLDNSVPVGQESTCFSFNTPCNP